MDAAQCSILVIAEAAESRASAFVVAGLSRAAASPDLVRFLTDEQFHSEAETSDFSRVAGAALVELPPSRVASLARWAERHRPDWRIVVVDDETAPAPLRTVSPSAFDADHEWVAWRAASAAVAWWRWVLDDRRFEFGIAWGRMVGVDPSPAGASPDEWLRRVHPADLDAVLDAIAHCLATGHDGRTRFRLLVQRHEYREVESSLQWVSSRVLRGEWTWAADSSAAVNTAAIDEVEDTRALVTRALARMAHDLNDHLVVVLGHCEFLASRLGSTHGCTSDVRQIEAAGKRATGLTRAILEGTLLHAEVTTTAARVEELDLEAVVERVLPTIGAIVESPIHSQLGDARTRVRIDATRLQLGLLHSVSWLARHRPPSHEPLRIEIAHRAGASARVRIGYGSGERIGINGSTYPTDFDDPDLRRAQGYLRSFGAEVAIDAHGVRVDISAIRDEVPVVDGRSLFRSRLEPHTVVLVDDNETVRSLVRRLLVRQGFRVLSAATGDEALRLCVAHRDRIDLLLTDIFLPDLGGRALAQRVGSVRPNLPVLYMSGYSRARIEGLSADDPFIAKPFTSDELFARVCALLS